MMIYESGYEKVAVAGGVSMADEPKIKRTRHILVIILTVFIVFLVLGAILSILEPSSDFEKAYHLRGTKIGNTCIAILWCTLGLFAARRYHVIGLRVFAWWGAISLVIYGIVSVVSIVQLIATSATPGKMIIAYIVVFILLFFIVQFAFQLARLIKTFKQSNNQTDLTFH